MKENNRKGAMEMRNPAGPVYPTDLSTEFTARSGNEQTGTEGLKIRPEKAISKEARKWQEGREETKKDGAINR